MSRGGSSSGKQTGSGEGNVVAALRNMSVRSGLGGSGGRRGGTVLHDFTHTRPESCTDKRGTAGRPIALKANFAKMVKYCDNPNEILIYQYHVSYEPQVDSKNVKMRMLAEKSEELGVLKPVYDGMILYLPRKLAINKLVSEHPNTKEEVIIKLEMTAELIPTDQQCTTFLNVTNRRVQELLGLIQIGRHFFNQRQATLVPNYKMEIWPGYNTAIRRYENDLLINVDVVHKLLRQDSVLQYIMSCLQSDGARGKETAAKDLIGTSILTKYNNKLYRVDDIFWDKHPETTTFEKADGTEINLVQYMQQQYQMEVKQKQQPLILSRAKKRGLDGNANADLLLIPELCFMTGLTERMRADTRVMKDVATKTRQGPGKRVEMGERFLQAVQNCPVALDLLKSWELEMEPELLRLKGRVLPPESLFFGDGRKTAIDARKGEWSRECRGKLPVDGRPLEENRWSMVFPERLYKDAEKLFTCLKGEGPPLGIKIGNPSLLRLPDDTAGNYVAACREAVKVNGAQLVLALVPNDNKERYDAIKKTCFNETPVPCQVVMLNTLKRDNILRSICQKIINQMNCKMGGALWRVEVPMKRIMIVGYDSYTDSSAKGKAVGAAVFSLNDNLTKWYCQADLHENMSMESKNLSSFLEKALLKYKHLNDCLPDRIFIYRAGVGEGMLPVVFNVELDLVKTALANVYGEGAEEAGKVRLAFTVVNKKINTRFFAETPKDYENPPPGTIVDDVVTRVERYDYFLIPQAVNQGTVTPVAYNVIYDKSGLKADQMQRLSFKLCHLYYNWQGTVRVPAPCQYAHKLAFLTSQSTHAPALEELHDTLYFL